MVDIVIVNWNSGDLLKKCVDSIITDGNKPFVNKIILVDNNSTDDSIVNLTLTENLHIIKNPDNKGFSKACNQGFKLCSAPYSLLLNPDAQLLAGTLRDCISFMESNTGVDILGCALLNDRGELTPSCARFPTPHRYIWDATGLSKLFPYVFTPAILMTDWDHASSRDVNQVMGAFMFMPTGIFRRYGFFDERFFVYYEELDFSKRVAQGGGRTFYNSQIKAIHSGGGTTNNVKAFRLFLNIRSRLQFARKHFSRAGYLTVWLASFIIEPITRTILLLFRGNLTGVTELYKAYRLLWKERK